MKLTLRFIFFLEKELYLPGNDLKELPQSIKLMESLEEVDLTNNKIRQLPELGCLELRHLLLSNNRLDTLPYFLIFKCTKLELLSLSNNCLWELGSNELFLSKLILSSKNLKDLTFYPQNETSLITK